MIFLWFIFLDAELMKRIPVNIRPSNTLFLINLILIFLSYVIVSIFFLTESFKVEGVLALPFLYFFYAFFSVYDHLSQLLTYAEEEKKIELAKRIGEMVLFFFYFIGVWWLQPRIIKVLDRPVIEQERYKKF